MASKQHPRIDRRAFLGGAAATALLAACRRARPAPQVDDLLPRPGDPVTLPITASNPPIAGGLPPESGPLRVYEWHQYLGKSVLDSFSERYGVPVQTESFANREQALENVRTGPEATFDVFFPTPTVLQRLAVFDVLQPLNHDYLANLGNLWPQFTGSGVPHYDEGQRFSIPYTVFSTGIAWRKDLVAPQDWPTVQANPYDMLWDGNLSGWVGMYDSYREAMAFALARMGADPNTKDPAAIVHAGDALVQFAGRMGGVFTAEGVYEELPEGKLLAHQAWSGDFMAAPYYETNRPAQIAPTLAYDFPAGGIVGVDLVAIPRHARNPVLAHLFINHLLDTKVALENFTWNGYQPPLRGITSSTLTGARWDFAVPDAVLTPEQFDEGTFLVELDPQTDARYRTEWERALSAAGGEHS